MTLAVDLEVNLKKKHQFKQTNKLYFIPVCLEMEYCKQAILLSKKVVPKVFAMGLFWKARKGSTNHYPGNVIKVNEKGLN